eukprot:gnl/TRDRNA2_/TRDRNA2_154984_c0_seq3.p1 gnl/TRDRNA2_/TRDRNA2_154984_c0~~gnl/TRDRNA2_/TRDRNA2_154984_c0_seq3.p1  ORF type:complete len:536 (-),score=120.53 gnl/TRDRNA2_/TRDRNA2_154984_c0_seq3:75-1682(-)
MIQAKLDTLLFNEESLKWIQAMLDLKPVHEEKARIFLKSILKMLQDENALNSPDLINDIGEGIQEVQEPLSVAQHMLRDVPGIPEGTPADGDCAPLNAYYARIARYFVFCVDAGLLGSEFTVFDLTDAYLVTEQSRRKMTDMLNWMLHIRPKDYTKPFRFYTLEQLLRDPNFSDYIFNDRMMQSLIELNYVSRQFANRGDPQGERFSLEYAKFLGLLLRSETSSMSLKAAICRHIMAADQEYVQPSLLAPELIGVMRASSVYLTTYATVTLVNMSGGQQLVKNMLMQMDIAPLLVEQLMCKDEDLITYTLVLLTNLTKSVHHRELMLLNGLVETSTDLLTTSYSNPFKTKVLAELASVIGQLCNDEDVRDRMTGEGAPNVDCLLYVFDTAAPGTKLKSKVMFALKQLCVNNIELKDKVGSHALPVMIADFKQVLTDYEPVEPENSDDDEVIPKIPPTTLDFCTNGIMLILLLSISKNNCILMHELMMDEVMAKMMSSQLGQLDSTRDRLLQLQVRLTATAADLAADAAEQPAKKK